MGRIRQRGLLGWGRLDVGPRGHEEPRAPAAFSAKFELTDLRCFQLMILSTDKLMNKLQSPNSRWVREMLAPDGATVTPAEEEVLTEVLKSLRRLRHGSIALAVQDGRVVQIETTEKRRL